MPINGKKAYHCLMWQVSQTCELIVFWDERGATRLYVIGSYSRTQGETPCVSTRREKSGRAPPTLSGKSRFTANLDGLNSERETKRTSGDTGPLERGPAF